MLSEWVAVLIWNARPVWPGIHNQGIGSDLLIHALENAVSSTDLGGLLMVWVDALRPEIRGFYEGFGFTPIGDNSFYMLIPKVRQTLLEAQQALLKLKEEDAKMK